MYRKNSGKGHSTRVSIYLDTLVLYEKLDIIIKSIFLWMLVLRDNCYKMDIKNNFLLKNID